jgi:hypothetical protein
LNVQPKRPYFAPQAAGSSIPPIIHQTHPDWTALPPSLHENIAKLRNDNPHWEYRFYDDEAVAQFIEKAYGPDILKRFERIDPKYGGARADLFRYLLMYRVGGIYLDIKSSATRPLDEILRPGDRLVLCQWPSTGRFAHAGVYDWYFAGLIEGSEFQQWHLLCAPGHPYIYNVIQAVLRNIDHYVPKLHGVGGKKTVLRLTGPIAYTLAIAPMLPMNQHRRVTDHEVLGLLYSVSDDNEWHKRLFRTHYSDLSTPVVKTGLFGRSLSACFTIYDTLRSAWRRTAQNGRRAGD